MGKKKRGHPDLQELLERPWCYYCERDFDDLKILISHQKAKHFKCDRCGRRLNTAGGLSVHMSQVHKETLTAVENALPNRSGLDVEIFGMEGVPQDVIQGHNQRVITQYHQAEADRRAATGNPAPGSSAASGGGNQPKKPKLESPAELKRRLAEHKAKLAEQAAGGSSGDVTPVGAGQGVQVARHASPAAPYQQTNLPLNGSAQQLPYAQPYTQAPYQQPNPAYPMQTPTGYPQYPNVQYTGAAVSPGVYQASPVGQPYMGTPTPPLPYHQPQPPMSTHTPPQTTVASLPPRPASLPAAPSLPQRLSFSAPQVNQFQLQQMHHGQVPVQPPATHPLPGIGTPQSGRPMASPLPGGGSTATSVDELISGAAKQADELAAKSSGAPSRPEESAAATPAEDKAAKKEKAKPTRLVYSDSEVSPEEKMARLPRYSFVRPPQKEETVLADATVAAVARTVDASEEVTNPPQ